MTGRLPAALRGWVLPLLLVGLWGLATDRAWIDSAFLASPARVAAAPFDPQVRALVEQGLVASVLRYVEGACLGVVLGTAFGLLLGLSPLADRLFGQSFHGFRQIAMFAWVPLFTAWFGVGETTKLAFVALAAFKPMVMAAQEGVRAAPVALREVGQSLCLSRRRTLLSIILPAALPALVTGLQLAFTFAWLATIGVEALVGFGNGLGAVLIEGRNNFRMDVVLFGILVIGGLGLLLHLALDRLAARVLRRAGARA
ncbi:ABC transporter permease [Sphingomonas desiccabilis]|uniref:ABC transporter permease subunit n=1 Tax=Sphingomonas desiccabilis TaxID=429134 RepID=A0A4Q2ISL8_9SPHN|nr:ABC transporter permease subunit [Sphingomonas desiccabilis]MBB3911804.1 sulfonate transport system permease protein [Sphingomonas desiccabilis]RXZ31477.1 ABC transporter permease subunit [Sphingomonas desiccabilis]